MLIRGYPNVDYVVEVRDVFKGLILFHETYDNANTAYSVKRQLEDEYLSSEDADKFVIELIEP